MSISSFCIEQRTREQETLKKFLLYSLGASAIFHTVLLVSLNWFAQDVQAVEEPIELIMVEEVEVEPEPAPEPTPEPTPEPVQAAAPKPVETQTQAAQTALDQWLQQPQTSLTTPQPQISQPQAPTLRARSQPLSIPRPAPRIQQPQPQPRIQTPPPQPQPEVRQPEIPAPSPVASQPVQPQPTRSWTQTLNTAPEPITPDEPVDSTPPPVVTPEPEPLISSSPAIRPQSTPRNWTENFEAATDPVIPEEAIATRLPNPPAVTDSQPLLNPPRTSSESLSPSHSESRSWTENLASSSNSVTPSNDLSSLNPSIPGEVGELGSAPSLPTGSSQSLSSLDSGSRDWASNLGGSSGSDSFNPGSSSNVANPGLPGEVNAEMGTPQVSAAPSGGYGGAQCVSSCQPSYPERLRRRGIEGDVVVRFRISSDGKAVEPEVVQPSSHEAFNEEALVALRRMRFEPPGNSNPTVQMTISFQLN